MSVQGSSLLSSWLIPYKTYNIHTYIHTYKNTHIETRYYVYLQSQIHLIRVIDLSCGHMYKPLYTSLGCLLSTVHSYRQHSLLVHLHTQGAATITHSLGVLYSIYTVPAAQLHVLTIRVYLLRLAILCFSSQVVDKVKWPIIRRKRLLSTSRVRQIDLFELDLCEYCLHTYIHTYMQNNFMCVVMNMYACGRALSMVHHIHDHICLMDRFVGCSG